MKTRLQELRDTLAADLARGNGGSWESDIQAIRKAFPDWFHAGDGWIGDSISEIASRFAIWVLYSSRPRTAADFGKARIEDADTVAKTASDATEIVAKIDPNGPCIFSGPEFYPRIVTGGEVLILPPSSVERRIRIELTKVNNSTGAVCTNCKRPFVLGGGGLYMDKQGVFCSEKCGREYPFPEDEIKIGDVLGVHSIDEIPLPIRERMNAGSSADVPVSEGEDEEFSRLAGIPVRVTYWNPDDRPVDARYCDKCRRHFTGPAKLDARFTFCGDVCQQLFGRKDSDAGAVFARPAIADPGGSLEVVIESIDNPPNQIEDLGFVDAADNAAKDVKDRNAESGVDDSFSAAIRANRSDDPRSVLGESFPFCGKCDRPIDPEDSFTITGPAIDAKPTTLCSVECVCNVLGVPIRPNTLFK